MKVVAFDTESHRIKPGMNCPRPVCLTYSYDGENVVLLDRADGLDWLTTQLLNPEIIFTGVNLPYDFSVCAAEDPKLLPLIFDAYEKGRVRCMSTRQCLIDIAKGEHKYRHTADGHVKTGYGLDDLVLYHFGFTVEKEGETPENPAWWRLNYGSLDGIPVDEWPAPAKIYASDDARWSYKLWDKVFKEEAFDIPNEVEQNCAAWALRLSSVWGLRTDAEATALFRKSVKKEYDDAYVKLKKIGIVREDGSRDMKLIGVIVEDAYKSAGLPVPRTPSGKAKTSEEVLTVVGDDGKPLNEYLALLGATSELRTTLSRYVPMLELGTKVPANPGWVPLLETGRVACREPNVMNPPRNAVKVERGVDADGKKIYETLGDVRSCFRPRPGKCYVGADYDGAELRSWCQVCISLLGYSTMSEAIKNGDDLHLRLAAVILGITYEEAVQRYNDGDEVVVETRQFSKKPNFSLPGGVGAPRLQAMFKEEGIIISLEQAKRYKQAWIQTWAEGKPYLDLVSAQTRTGECMVHQISSGRIRYVSGPKVYSETANTYFQALTSDGAKAAMWQIQKECYLEELHSPLYGARLVLFLHDEFILECDEDRADAVATRLREVMISEMKKFLPDVPVDATPICTRKWIKGAKPVRLDGKLVPGRAEKQDGKTVWVPDLLERMAA
jgi:hypothetical protein